MARFTIRVVLHDNASREDYEKLETELENRGITDVITSGDGTRYKMPPAEYQCDKELTSEQVRDLCVAAAKTTGKRHAVLVTTSNGRAWTGLDKV